MKEEKDKRYGVFMFSHGICYTYFERMDILGMYGYDNLLLLVESRENKGKSVTNSSSAIVTEYCHNYSIDPERTLFLELYDNILSGWDSSLTEYKTSICIDRVNFRKNYSMSPTFRWLSRMGCDMKYWIGVDFKPFGYTGITLPNGYIRKALDLLSNEVEA
jgi:hypothetical protein